MRRAQLFALALGTFPSLFAQGGFNGPGRYIIRNAQSGLALDLRGNELTQTAPRNSPTQIWELQQAGPDVFYIRNAASGGCALEFDQDRNSSPVHCNRNNNDNQHWRLEPAGDGFLIISRFRKPLDIPDGTNREGIRVQIYDRNGDANQRFILERVGGGPGPVTAPGIGGFGAGRGGDGGRRDGDRDRDGKYFDQRDKMWRMDGDGACLYRDTDFRGEALCVRAGQDIPDVSRAGGGSFQSLKFFGRAREVEIYQRGSFRGDVVRLNRDESNLRRVRAGRNSAADALGSFRVN